MAPLPASWSALKSLFKRLLAIALSLALVAWLLHDARWQALLEQLQRLSPTDLLVATAAFTLSYLLRAARVFDEFRHLGPVRFALMLRLTLLHNAAINVLPFRSGEAAFPLLLKRWFGIDTTRAIAALLWLRLQDACVVMLLAAAVWPNLPLWLRVLAALAVVALALWVPRWAHAHPQALQTSGRFGTLLGKLRAALAESTHGSARSWGWTVANWSVKLAAEAWLLAALLAVTLSAGSAGALGVELAAILPVQGVAGFGTYEAGGAALLLGHGVSLADGLQAALVLHLFVITLALIGGAIALLALPAATPDNTGST